jgi:hypothetical protein
LEVILSCRVPRASPVAPAAYEPQSCEKYGDVCENADHDAGNSTTAIAYSTCDPLIGMVDDQSVAFSGLYS